QRGDTEVEMRAGRERDPFARTFLPVQDGDDDRNAKIARHIQDLQAASHGDKLSAQIANVTVSELIDVDPGAAQAIVPPNRARIAFDEFEEALNDGLLQRVAGSASARVGCQPRLAGGIVKKIKEAGRKVLEALVAQRPDRRPFGLVLEIEAPRSAVARVRLAIRGACALCIAEK